MAPAGAQRTAAVIILSSTALMKMTTVADCNFSGANKFQVNGSIISGRQTNGDHLVSFISVTETLVPSARWPFLLGRMGREL